MGGKEIKIVQFLQLHYGYFVAVAFFLGDMCALPSSPVINANVGHKSTKASPVSPLLLLDARMPGCQCAGMPGWLHPSTWQDAVPCGGHFGPLFAASKKMHKFSFLCVCVGLYISFATDAALAR